MSLTTEIPITKMESIIQKQKIKSPWIVTSSRIRNVTKQMKKRVTARSTQ